MTGFPKPRPKALDKKERARAETRYEDAQWAIAKERDHGRCRICGDVRFLTKHHMKPRSSFGPKRVEHKHHHSNLLSCCIVCHGDVTGHILEVVPDTEEGTNGTVTIRKYDNIGGGYNFYAKSSPGRIDRRMTA